MNWGNNLITEGYSVEKRKQLKNYSTRYENVLETRKQNSLNVLYKNNINNLCPMIST